MAILNVGPGQTYTTIQAAIDAASAGDTIVVAAGTYAETVTVGVANLTILGANHATVAHDMGAFNGARGAESVLTGTFILNADGLTISGFEVTGAAAAFRANTGGQALDNITLSNNYIHDTTDSPIRMGLGFGGGIGSDNWTITGNLIDGINGNARTGMVLFNIDGLTVTNNVIDHDVETSLSRRGINLDGVRNATVTGNTIDMGLVAPTDATAAGGAAPWAIQLSMSDRTVENVNVSGNTVGGSSTGIVGLSQRSMVNVDIAANTVTNVVNGVILNGGSVPPQGAGVTMDVDVTGNTISAFASAILARDLHDAHVNGPVTFVGLDVTGNTITAGAVQIGRAEASGNGLANVTGPTTVDGGSGNDSVRVEGSGSVTFNAGSGTDTFIGGTGNDTVNGGAGNDAITGGTGTDTATGYSAAATISIATSGPATGRWIVTDGTDVDVLVGVEKVVIGGTTYLLVDKTGAANGGFQSVQAAVDAAVGGETILIAPGSYTETEEYVPGDFHGLYINKPNLTLQGVKADGSLITTAADADALGPTIIAGAQNMFGANHWIDVGGTNTIIRGVHLQAGPETNNKLLEIWAENVTVEDSFLDVNIGGTTYSYAVAIYFNETDPSATDVITKYTIDGNILNEGIAVAGGVGTPGTIGADQKITNNQFVGTFDPVSGEGRYDTIVINGQIAGIGWLNEPTQTPTISGNTFAGNSVPFLLRGGDNSAANLPSASQIATILANNGDATTQFAYVVDSTTGELVTATRDLGSGPSQSFAVTNTIDTLNLALDTTPDAVFGGQRVFMEAGDTVIVQSGSGAVDSAIMVDDLIVKATANSADLDLTLATTLADSTPIAGGGVVEVTLADYAAGLGANVDVTGNDLDNVITGNSGANALDGAGGNDTLTGNGGNDTLTGGTGTDTAVYAADVTVTTSGGSWSVNAGATEGTDTLSGVEIVDDGVGGRILLVGNTGFATIQAAVNAAADGDTILIASGSYAEDVTVTDKAIAIVGAEAGVIVNGRFAVSDTMVAGDVMRFENITINADGKAHGISVRSSSTDVPGVNAGAVVLDGVSIANANEIGFFYAHPANGSNPVNPNTIGTIEILNSSFTDNGHLVTGARGQGHVNLFGFNGNLTIDSVTMTGPATNLGDSTFRGGTITTGFEANPDKAFSVTGIRTGTPGVGGYVDAGNVTFNDVTITGNYSTDALALYTIQSFASLSIADVSITARAPWGLVNFDGVSGAIDLSGVTGTNSASGGLVGSLQGLATGEAFTGTAGVDFLSGRAGGDGLNGGDGNDTASYATSDAGVTVNLAAGTGTGGHAQGDTFASIENVVGSAFADLLTGNADANILNGGVGNDTLAGNGSNDTLTGGTGTDTAAYAGAITAAMLTAVTDADPLTLGDQAGWKVATGSAEGTDNLVGVEIVDGAGAGKILLVGSGAFATIQAAVNAAADGDTILIASGTYIEQVVVDGKNNLTIQEAAGANVTIKAPADVVETARSGSDRELHGVFTVKNASNVTLIGVTVDGDGRANTIDEGGGAGEANYVGVIYRNASGGLQNVDVVGVRDPYEPGMTADGKPVVSGMQRGVGVQVDNDTILAFSMQGGSISDFQKNATVFNRADLDVSGVTITGGGAQTINAQNGIQALNSTGVIGGNMITGIGYAGPAFAYSGAMLLYGNTDLAVTNNTITGTNGATSAAKVVGIFVFDAGTPNSGNTITDNVISGVDVGVDVSGAVGANGFVVLRNAVSAIDTSDPYAAGVSFSPNDGAAAHNAEGSALADILDGGNGDDTLAGLAGEDTLAGGLGNDLLNGGADTDVANYAGAESTFTVTRTGATSYTVVDNDTVANGNEGTDTLVDLENAFFASGPLKALAELANTAPVDIDLGNLTVDEDTLGAVVGNVTGEDFLYGMTPDILTFSVDDSRFEVVAGVLKLKATEQLDHDLEPSVTINITATDSFGKTYSEAFTIAVDDDTAPAAPVITGYTLDTGIPADNITGDNTLTVTGTAEAGSTVKIFAGMTQVGDGVANGSGVWSITTSALGLGPQVLTATATDAALNVSAPSAVLNVTIVNGILGDDNDNNLVGTAAVDHIVGFGGNDVLRGLAGADQLDGGLGSDTASYAGSAVGVAVSLATGIGIGGDAEGDRLFLIENLTGSDLADTLIGDGNDNVLKGGLGNDRLEGGGGNDTADYSGAALAATVTLRDGILAATVAGAAFGDTLLSIENVIGTDLADTLTGNSAANVLIGGLGADRLNGGLGADVMNGGLGADTYTVDNVNDVVIDTDLLLANGSDLVNASVSFSLDTANAAGVERLTLTGAANVDGTGNALVNNLTGNAGNNVLSGLGGADLLSGLNGNDTLWGGADNDRLLGGADTDVLYGEAGRDTLDGGTGNDTMYGGTEDDTYFVDSVDDVVIELLNEGINDFVNASVTHTLSSHVERLTLTGTGHINGTGNNLANPITGNAGNNTLVGLDGNDRLIGGAGNDTLLGGNDLDILEGGLDNDIMDAGNGADFLTGGTGADTLTGGSGRDTFVYTSAAESFGLLVDTITDFESWTMYVANSLVERDTIRLNAIDANTLVAADQAFVFISAGAFTAAGQLRAEVIGADTFIHGNTDANFATAEFTLKLANFTTLLDNRDFVL